MCEEGNSFAGLTACILARFESRGLDEKDMGMPSYLEEVPGPAVVTNREVAMNVPSLVL
jgi:hypothetical protein